MGKCLKRLQQLIRMCGVCGRAFPRLRVAPRDPAIGRMQVVYCRSEAVAFEYLAAQDPHVANPSVESPFLYRGQTFWHSRPWPPRQLPSGIMKHQYRCLESVMAQESRGLEDLKAIEPPLPDADPRFDRYREGPSLLRSVLTFAIIDEVGQALSQGDHQVVMDWLAGCLALPDGTRFDAAGSIGQHYGFPTGYLDATSDLRVAFWFATHLWGSDSYAKLGASVVYRIDRHILEVVRNEVNQLPGWGGRDACRPVCISGIPTVIGQRPQNQSGWSLINCEQATVQLRLIELNGLQAVRFPRFFRASAENVLSKDFIIPPNELVAGLIEQMQNGQLFSATRQQYVDQFLNPARPPNDLIDLHDPKWNAWLFPR